MDGRLERNEVLAACRKASVCIDDDVVVMNHGDIAAVSFSGNAVSGITLKGGRTAYRYIGGRGTFASSWQMQKGRYDNKYRHGLSLEVTSRTQDNKDGIGQIKDARLVAIVRNLDKGNDQTRYELYGLRNGMEAQAIDFTSTNTDGIVADIILASSEGRPEPMQPYSVWAGSLAATEQMIESLFGNLLFRLDINALGSAYRLG